MFALMWWLSHINMPISHFVLCSLLSEINDKINSVLRSRIKRLWAGGPVNQCCQDVSETFWPGQGSNQIYVDCLETSLLGRETCWLDIRGGQRVGGNRGNVPPRTCQGGGIAPPWLSRKKNTFVRIGWKLKKILKLVKAISNFILFLLTKLY